MTYEEKIKQLVKEDFIEEARWISDNEFIVWIYYFNLEGFTDKVKKDFGCYAFDDGGFHDAILFEDMIAINICELLQGYTTEHFSDILPYKEYSI